MFSRSAHPFLPFLSSDSPKSLLAGARIQSWQKTPGLVFQLGQIGIGARRRSHYWSWKAWPYADSEAKEVTNRLPRAVGRKHPGNRDKEDAEIPVNGSAGNGAEISKDPSDKCVRRNIGAYGWSKGTKEARSEILKVNREPAAGINSTGDRNSAYEPD
jgi:hypothetical protein